MKKTLIYWIFTLWLALGMASTGLVQLLRRQEEVDSITALGYPLYFLTILGIWKMLGVIAILIPRAGLLKEWAYAGMFFAMSGAIFSRLAAGDHFTKITPALLLLSLTVLSWKFRPEDRRPALARVQK